MELFPAIDLRGGRCVRLRQGDYGDETVYGDDPVAVARSFADAGASWVHVVDLDAARSGTPENRPVVAAIAADLGGRGVHVQTGGGVRDRAAAEALLGAGVRRVVVGTAAVEDPAFVAALAADHPGRVAVGLDARLLPDGRYEVAVRGWTEGSSHDLFDVLARLEGVGVAAVVITEIGRDGMLTGPDLDGLGAALATTAIDVIASGGVSSLDDLRALRSLRAGGADGAGGADAAGRALAGAIAGKAIYERRFEVAEAVAVCRGERA